MPTIIVITPLFLMIIVVAVAVGIYFFVYRRHVNKVLRENYDGNTPVRRLPAIPAVVSILWAAAVLICTWVSVSQLSILYSKMEELSEQNRFMYDNMILLCETIKDEVSKSNQLVTFADISFGEIDTESCSAEITFMVSPKLLYTDAELTLTVENQVLSLTEQSPGVYTGSIMLDILASYDSYPLLTIEREGIQQTEYLEDIELDEVREHYFPDIFTSYKWDESSDGGHTFISGYLDLYSKEVLDSFSSIDMTVKINDNVEIEKNLLQNKDIFFSSGEDSFLEEKIRTGDELQVIIEGKYLNGYGYKQSTLFIYDYEEKNYMIYSDFYIYDHMGNLINR